jgi:hypothetical protein
MYSFESIAYAQDLIEEWRHDYNDRRAAPFLIVR